MTYLIYIISLWIGFRLLKILFAHICEYSLSKNYNVYSWFWIILPNWRYYLRLCYTSNHRKYGRYSDFYWKPNRVELWKINGYKYKFF